MKIDRHTVTTLVLVVLLPVSTLMLYRAVGDARAYRLFRGMGLEAHSGSPRLHWTSSYEYDIKSGGARPASNWSVNRKAVYRRVLTAAPPGTYDTLLVPFENYPADRTRVPRWLEDVPQEGRNPLIPTALDVSGRALMTLVLAERLAATTQARFPDPVLVRRALGEEAREFDDDEARELAQALGAKTVIFAHVGHQPPRRLMITLRWRSPMASAVESWHTWGPLSFSDERLPEDMFRSVADEIVAQIGLPPKDMGGAAAPAQLPDAPAPLPADPFDLVRAPAPDPLTAIYTLQLYGLLAPAAPARARERLFERSLVLLDSLAREHPRYRLLRARAQFHLERRPAALATLGQPQLESERALQALLAGDEAALAAVLANIDDPWEQLIARIEHIDLLGVANADDRIDALRKELIEQHEAWTPILWHKLAEADAWAQPFALGLKSELDRVMPVTGFTLEERLSGADASLAAISDVPVIALGIEHVYRVLARDQGALCCLEKPLLPRPQDYLDLLAARFESSLLEAVDHQLTIQGRAGAALAMLNDARELLDGHPDLTALEAEALVKSAERDPAVAKKTKLLRAAEVGANAVIWAGGQTVHAARARGAVEAVSSYFFEMNAIREIPRVADRLGLLYEADFPPRRYWPRIEVSLDAAGFPATRPWDYEYASFYPLYVALLRRANKGDVEGADALLTENAHRFLGDPYRTDYQADYLLRTGRPDEALALHRSAIEAGKGEWSSYFEVGKHHVRDGRFSEAAETFGRYPGFRAAKPANSVALANHAYNAASELFWRGAPVQSRPLFEIAARLATGSAASLGSAQRIAQFDRDWKSAIGYARYRTRRYGDAFAYRDLLALLFATRRSEEAWSLFDTRAMHLNRSEVWFGAFVGLRADGRDLGQTADWIRQRHELVMDRGGSEVLTKFAFLALGADRPANDLLETVVSELEAARRGPTRYGAFARGYTAMKRGDPVAALAQLVPESDTVAHPVVAVAGSLAASAAQLTSRLPPPDPIEWLPYAVRAATASGQTEVALARIAAVPPGPNADDEWKFAFELANSVLAGNQGDVDGALASLKRACGVQPIPNDRAFPPWYALLEFAEWLYQDTNDARFRALLVKWARALQDTLPTVSWGYVFEALYGDDAARRQTALGIALHLDANSDRLSSVGEPEKAAARAWIEKHAPFDADDGNTAAPPI